MIYASSGTEIKCFDVRLATKEWKLLENYNYNKEEINKVVCNLKSSFLAAADDSGEVKWCFGTWMLIMQIWSFVFKLLILLVCSLYITL
nr:WD repeat-containing protein 53-like isoform X2 [Arachis hypogaea]